MIDGEKILSVVTQHIDGRHSKISTRLTNHSTNNRISPTVRGKCEFTIENGNSGSFIRAAIRAVINRML
ncbi:MAG: hypothetical protein GY820_23530 [Gammaproteobacteria bacterium]|nr:hypothetical protein [Gammaproteobacteria bacterium]